MANILDDLLASAAVAESVGDYDRASEKYLEVVRLLERAPVPLHPTIAELAKNSRENAEQMKILGASLAKPVPVEPVEKLYENPAAIDKGIENPIGANNCFLNVILQSLWHLDAFRQPLLEGAHQHEPACLYCALRLVFQQYALTHVKEVSPDQARHTLASLFRQQSRFQIGQLGDAEETYVQILEIVHSLTTCPSPPCPSHAFSQSCVEQFHCPSCGSAFTSSSSSSLLFCLLPSPKKLTANKTQQTTATTATTTTTTTTTTPTPTPTTDTNHEGASSEPVTSDAWAYHAYTEASGLRLSSPPAAQSCPEARCPARAAPSLHLLAFPELFTIAVVWPEDPSLSDLRAVLQTFPADLFLTPLFTSLPSSSPLYRLRGLVCYYGHHYISYFHNDLTGQWVMFDDVTVRPVSPNLSDIRDRLARGHFQPQLLFYQKVTAPPSPSPSLPASPLLLPIPSAPSPTPSPPRPPYFRYPALFQGFN